MPPKKNLPPQTVHIKRPPRSLSTNLLVALLAPLVFFVGLEIAARACVWIWAGFSKDAYQTLHLQLSGQTGYFYHREDKYQIFHPLGFKKGHTDFTFKRPDNPKHYRILVLGGSATAGSEHHLYSWPYIMEFMLRTQNPDLDIVVVNGGIWAGLAANERQQVFNLRNYHWDLIVNYSGWNDLYSYNLVNERVLINVRRANQHCGRFGQLWFRLKAHSMALSLLAHAYVKNYQNVDTKKPVVQLEPLPLTDANREKLFQMMGSQLEDIFHMTQERHVPVLHIFQGSLGYMRSFRPLTAQERLYQLNSARMFDESWNKAVDFYYPQTEKFVRALCSKYPHVTYMNYLERAYYRDDLFEDDCHFQVSGLVIAAQIIGQFVQTQYFKRPINDWKQYRLHMDGHVVVLD